MTPPPIDVAVIGGGPAGATAARLLREWGHAVLLLHRPPGSRPPLAVSIPPSTRKILAAVGALSWVEDHGFLRTTGNTSWWSTDTPRVEGFSAADGGTGFQVLRADLEDLLLGHAVASGVTVCDDLRVRDVGFDDPAAARLSVVGPEGCREEIRARHVLDASGRSGVVARNGFRRKDGAVTLALTAVWRRDGGFPGIDDSHTLVEAYASGWAWSVPLAKSLRHVTVMIDPPSAVPGRRDLASLYGRELRRAEHLEAIVASGERTGASWAADASTYGASAFAASGLLLVGDAGSFIDPLSSYGVKKALASAWLAAVATHTALRHPERAEMARAFFSRREEQMQLRYAREAARYAAEAASRYPGSAFWSARAAPSDSPSEDADDELAAADEIQAAWEALKSRPRLGLGLGPDVRFASGPLVVGHEIVMADALVRETGGPIHFVDGVHAPTLARLAPSADQVGQLYEAYNRAAPEVALGELVRGLATLLAAGLLRHREP